MTKAATKKRVKAGTSKASAEDKRKAFVEAYFANGGNGTQAAITAGFAEKSAGVAAARLLKDARVLTEIERRRIEIAANLELNTERTFKEVARIAYADPRRIMDEKGRILLPHELDAETAAAIASFEISFDGSIKYKFWPKTTALDMANKIQGGYEKDNRQKTDPLRELLAGLNGNVLGVRKDVGDDDELAPA